jgi:hypothetical protein
MQTPKHLILMQSAVKDRHEGKLSVALESYELTALWLISCGLLGEVVLLLESHSATQLWKEKMIPPQNYFMRRNIRNNMKATLFSGSRHTTSQ